MGRLETQSELSYDSLQQFDRSLACAVICRSLKLGLDRPQEERFQVLFAATTRAALEQAAWMLEPGAEGGLKRALASIYAGSPPPLSELSGDHERLFGHTLCPYECEYGRQALWHQARELADLDGFYESFGFGPDQRRAERLDHVLCEIEFLEFLALEKAHALERQDGESWEITQRAAGRFLRRHLARFGRAFCRTLQAADPEGFYGAQGSVLEAFLEIECEQLGVPIGPAALELRAADFKQAPWPAAQTTA